MEPDGTSGRQNAALTPQRIDELRMATLGALSGRVAHQLNNSLAVVIGNAGLLGMDAEPGSPSARLLEQIETAGQVAATLVREMATFGADASEGTELVDLSQMIPAMDALLRSTIGSGKALSQDHDPQVPPVDGHPRQLAYLILSLVWDAASSLDGRTGAIMITTSSTAAGAPSPDGPGAVTIEVSGVVTGSSGPSPSSARPQTGGGPSGASAAMLEIVEAHGGTMTVERGEGGESTTRVVLPGTHDGGHIGGMPYAS